MGANVNIALEGTGQTVNVATAVLCTLPLVSGRSYNLTGTVVGRTAGGATAAGSVSAGAKSVAGVSAAVGAALPGLAVADAALAAAVITIVVNVGAGTAELSVTGVAAQTINWVGGLRGKEF